MTEPQLISTSRGRRQSASNGNRVSTYLGRLVSRDGNTTLKSAHDYKIIFQQIHITLLSEIAHLFNSLMEVHFKMFHLSPVK